ncbi:MAG TPA: sugar ABC transporter permease [Gaiellaceae bacterium]|nr:sugar ABC transporter permease [Gaiellaceae bacterium]
MSTQPLPAPAAPAPDAKGRQVSLRSGVERLQGFLFVLPALVVLAIFLIYPAYYTIRLAFYEGDFHFGFFHYLGIDNFKQLLTNDKDFLDLSKFPPGGALINNLRWLIFYISISLLIGVGLAVLAVRVRYERFVKTAIFLPMAISAVAVGIIWLFVYSPDPDIGVLNGLFRGVGLHEQSWLGNPSLVNYALIFAYIWASVGFVMVVLSAAIKGLPADVLEAARVDGANEWQIFRRIMFPMLSLPISVVTIWLFINVIKVFDIIYVMTGGGPGTTSRVIAFTMYEETFHNGRPGYGAAVAAIMLVLIAPVMILNVRRFRSERVVG